MYDSNASPSIASGVLGRGARPTAVDDPAVELAHALRARYGHLDAAPLLETMIQREFAGSIALVSAFGAESVVLLDLVSAADRATPVIFLDTGKLFAETLTYRDELAAFLGLEDVRTARPEPAALAAADPGGDLWRPDADACCHIRKVAPLADALDPFDAWITGRKRYQGGERTALETIEAAGGRIKINPLAHWSRDAVERHIASRGLPRHPLADAGYRSIGCRPCTRRAGTHEGPRAGRWDGSAKTECGIHRSGWMQSAPHGPT